MWGERWLRRPVSREEADPALLMWAIRRSVVLEALPAERAVVHFRFLHTDHRAPYWWLVLTRPEVDLCISDPGFGTDLTVRSEPRTLAGVYMGDVGLAAALRRREIELVGPAHMRRAFAGWFGLSSLATLERARPLAERPPLPA